MTRTLPKLILILAATCSAQSPDPRAQTLDPKALKELLDLRQRMTDLRNDKAENQVFYKLDFLIREVDAGKILNSRTYSVVASTDRQFAPSIRTGSKVPSFSGPNGQYTFLEVGVNIDCRYLKQVDQNLAIHVTADVSSLAKDVAAGGQVSEPPVIRQNKWSSEVIIPLRKPTIIFSSDDNTSKHQMQLQLTATPVKE